MLNWSYRVTIAQSDLPRFFARDFSMSETHEAHVIPFTLKNTLAVCEAVSSSLSAHKICLLSSRNKAKNSDENARFFSSKIE